MPTRILREGILTSRRVNSLAPPAELFYRRLMSVVDDYGRYFSHESLLRAACYPFQLSLVSDSQVATYRDACIGAKLIFHYSVDGTDYLQMLDTRQQIRSKSKFPEPDEQLYNKFISNANQSKINRQANVLVVEGVVVVEGESTTMSGKPDAVPLNNKKSEFKTECLEILAFLNTKAGRNYQPVKVNLDFIKNRLREGGTPVQCRQVIAKKCREWGGDEKMSVYLRPATLFNRTKFSQYVGELRSEDQINGMS